jgi:hypothetical protein
VGERSLQAAQPPVEFTAWVSAGPEVHPETTQEVAVSLPDGEMTITRQRGVTWNPSLHDMSDPRLEGTLYEARDEDTYTLPGNEKGPHFGVRTYRIENDEGAWQGSAVSLESTDGRYYYGPYVMTGEGAYEGLTAILVNPDQSNRFTGYIIEGTIPAPPVPQTGG